MFININSFIGWWAIHFSIYTFLPVYLFKTFFGFWLVFVPLQPPEEPDASQKPPEPVPVEEPVPEPEKAEYESPVVFLCLHSFSDY